MEDVGEREPRLGGSTSVRVAHRPRGLARDTKVAVAIYALLDAPNGAPCSSPSSCSSTSSGSSTHLVDRQVYMRPDRRGRASGKGHGKRRAGLSGCRAAAGSSSTEPHVRADGQGTGCLRHGAGARRRVLPSTKLSSGRASGSSVGWRLSEAEFARFEFGDRSGAVSTSLGRTRALRKTYESSLADADALAVGGIEAARNSVAATWSRTPPSCSCTSWAHWRSGSARPLDHVLRVRDTTADLATTQA